MLNDMKIERQMTDLTPEELQAAKELNRLCWRYGYDMIEKLSRKLRIYEEEDEEARREYGRNA